MTLAALGVAFHWPRAEIEALDDLDVKFYLAGYAKLKERAP